MTPTAVIETSQTAMAIPDSVKALSPIEQRAYVLSKEIEAFVVNSHESREKAEKVLENANTTAKELWAQLDLPVKEANAHYVKQRDRRDNACNPVEAAKKTLKQRCIAYDQEQERIRQEEQRKAEEAARKQAEEEQIALAAQLEKEGDRETAEAILEQPVQVAPVIIPRSTPAPSRLSAGRTVWYASVTDVKKLCAAIGNGTASTEFVMGLDKDKKTGIISSPALNKMATAMKQTMNVPGVVAKSKTV